MVRSEVLPETTLGRKHLPTHQVLAPRGDPLREARFHFYRLRYCRVLHRLHSSEINQHALVALNAEVAGGLVVDRVKARDASTLT